MASNTKRTKAVRKWKETPNKENLKKDQTRIEENRRVLKELAQRAND